MDKQEQLHFVVDKIVFNRGSYVVRRRDEIVAHTREGVEVHLHLAMPHGLFAEHMAEASKPRGEWSNRNRGSWMGSVGH